MAMGIIFNNDNHYDKYNIYDYNNNHNGYLGDNIENTFASINESKSNNNIAIVKNSFISNRNNNYSINNNNGNINTLSSLPVNQTRKEILIHEYNLRV